MLIVNSKDLCKGKPGKAVAKFSAHNGTSVTLKPPVKAACGKAKKKRKAKKRH